MKTKPTPSPEVLGSPSGSPRTTYALHYYLDPPRWFEKWAAIGPCFTQDPAKAASFPSHDDAMRELGKFPVMCPTDVVTHPAENTPAHPPR